jgi:hypothetical protein
MLCIHVFTELLWMDASEPPLLRQVWLDELQDAVPGEK